MDNEEREVLQFLDAILKEKSVKRRINLIVKQVERKLARDDDALLAWEPIPMNTYGERLPSTIRSSWVFILRAEAETGAERHPNSHQRMMSYRGKGDLQISSDERWCSNHLISNPDARIEERWVSIPPNVWHQAVVPQKNWVVVSYHTVPEHELIEERPDPVDTKLTRQRRYLDQLE